MNVFYRLHQPIPGSSWKTVSTLAILLVSHYHRLIINLSLANLQRSSVSEQLPFLKSIDGGFLSVVMRATRITLSLYRLLPSILQAYHTTRNFLAYTNFKIVIDVLIIHKTVLLINSHMDIIIMHMHAPRYIMCMSTHNNYIENVSRFVRLHELALKHTYHPHLFQYRSG